MNIYEIPIITDPKKKIHESIQLLSESMVRSYEGMDFISLKLDEESAIYFYIFDYDTEKYHYLWDLIIPHAVGCVLALDWDNELERERCFEALERLEQRYDTPVTVCSFSTDKQIPEELAGRGFSSEGDRRVIFLNENIDSMKETVMAVLSAKRPEMV